MTSRSLKVLSPLAARTHKALLLAALTPLATGCLSSSSDDGPASDGMQTGGQPSGIGGMLSTGGTPVLGSGGSASGGAPSGTGGGVAGGDTGGTGGSLGGGGNVECAGPLPTTALDGADHVVRVDPVKSWGALPHFWDSFGTGHLGLYLREDRDWGATLMQHTEDGVATLGMKRIRSHGLFHDDIGIYSEDESGNPVYNWENSDKIFNFLLEQGIEPIIELAPMPSALAADPSLTVFQWEMIVSPPKDYAKWQDLVRAFVQHSVDTYGEEVVSKWYFEVWNEPECCNNKFWGGSLEDYHRLYDYAAAGVREALPGGRVGGPVTSQPLELEQSSEAGVLFLDHVTTDNYVNPGSPGILDFFTYHSWSFVGGAVDGYFQGVDLLDRYGLTEVPIAITEFGPTWEFNLYDEPQEMHQGAAFVAQVFSDISQRAAQENKRFPLAYSWWVLSDIFEEDPYREDEPFIGCMGLISREGLHKPAYNSYKFLTQMSDQQVALNVEGIGDVGGMATLDDKNGIQIIVYNGQSPGNGPTDDTYYAETEAHEIAVNVSGLSPTMAYDVTAYRVDDTRGNAYASWQGMGRPAMPDMTDEQWQTLRDTMDSPPEPLGQAVCGTSFSQKFSLTSPGVLFITMTPSE